MGVLSGDRAVLRANLREVYAALRTGHPEGHLLVANIQGTNLYVSSKGWGKVWKWFYGIASLLIGKGFQANRFQKAMQHTHLLFKRQLEQAAASAAEYRQSIQNALKGLAVDSKSSASRKAIRSWHESSAPLVKLVKKSAAPGLSDFIHTGFHGDSLNSCQSAPFSCGSHAKDLSKLRRIVDLEGYLQASLPWPLLLKAAAGQTFHAEEAKQFKAFALRLEKHASKMGVKEFHKVLMAAVEVGKSCKDDPGATYSTVNLEMALIDNGLSIFLKSDPEHIAWRKCIMPGSHLACKQYELIVGQQIGAKPEGQEDKNLIFAIENVPEAVLSIGINRAMHPLKKKIADDHGWGLKSAKVIEIDPKGRYAVIERLKEPIDSYQWKSADDELDPDDEDVGTPLWRLLQWFLEQKKTPHHFNPEYLMFNSKGRLKCTKVSLEGEFDFDALEAFAYKCSKGHSRIFQFLMEGSGLTEHAYAKFYEKVFGYAVNGVQQDVKDVAAAMDVKDGRIVATGEKLKSQAIALKAKCKVQLKEKMDAQLVEKDVQKALIVCYKLSGAAGLLPEFLEKQVMEEVLA